jgi:hypothetical protein
MRMPRTHGCPFIWFGFQVIRSKFSIGLIFADCERPSLDERAVTIGIQRIRITPDGKQYACSIEQELEELHLAEGLR